MNGIKIELHGFKELDKLLTRLPNRVEKKVLQGAVTGSLRETRKQIKKAAPVGKTPSKNSEKYGSLKKNIRLIRLKRVRPNERAARIDTGRAIWGVWYELGTRKQSARPFFRPTFERSVNAIFDNLRDRLGSGIEKEVKKLK